MKKQINILTLLLLLCSFGLKAQETVTVTGTVLDTDNEPLIGVNIAVKDQVNTGTITDFDGNFSIKVLPYSTLIFTYIGFERQEINIADKKVLHVVLKGDNVLDEIVITAAGAQRKVSSTGAITTVDIKKLNVPSSNLSNSLIGNVAGVIARQASGQPGENKSEFWIRGISTFGANQGALVLVDGFERDFNEINIEDIESFSILKDASATAIYGSRGANGVVLVTTKRGQAGKININSKVEYGYSTRTRTPKFADGVTYAQMVNEALKTRNNEPLYTAEEIDIIRYQLDPDLYPNVDWMDMLLRDGASTYRASLNFDGGGTTARYFVSGSYIEEGGMYKTDKSMKDYNTNANMSRWNYRTNFDMDLTRTTLISIGVAGHLQKQNKPGLGNDIWHSAIGQNPVSVPIMYSNGLVPAYGTGNKTNPWVLSTQTGFVENWESVSQINLNLKQDLSFITEGLRFEGRFGLDNKNINEIRRVKWPEQYRAERRRDLNGDLVFERISDRGFLKQESSGGGERYFNFEAEMHYNRLFAQKHRIGGLIKFLQSEKRTTVDLGEDIIKGIPNRNLGVSGRVTYGFMDRYLGEFNFGYTGSETFKPGYQFGFFPAFSVAWNIAEESFIKNSLPWLTIAKVRYSYGVVGNDDIDQRFPFRSAISSVVTKKEADDSKDPNKKDETFKYIFSDTKVEEYFRYIRHYTKVTDNTLTWEIAKKHNLGFDLDILNSAFTLTLDVFKDTREDIFMQRKNLSQMTGVYVKEKEEPWANVGKMQSKGFDGSFGFTQNFGEVQITLRGNMTYAKNEVLEYDEESNSLAYQMTKGYRYEQVKGLIALGLFEDYDDIRTSPKQTFGDYMPGDIKYKDVNGDGVIDDKDMVAIGATAVPNLIYGLGLSAIWRGIDFNIHFQGAGSSSKMLEGFSVHAFKERDWGNIFAEAADPANRWISRDISGSADTERTDALYPRLSYGENKNNHRASTYWLRDSKYVRLKTLEIGYTFPKKVLTKAGISNARIFFLGNNLALWDSLKLWDPELDTNTGEKYPLPKTYTIGLTFGF